MSAAVRPIHVPGAAALESLRQRAQAALDAWARDWVSECASGAQPTVALQVCSESDEARAQAHERYDALQGETGCIWFRCSPADRLGFGSAVVGTALMSGAAYVDDWIGAVAEKAWDERNRALCAALLNTPTSSALPASMSASLFAFGSGAVELSCDELGLHAIADRGVWRSVAPLERGAVNPLPGLTPLAQAVHRSRVRLEVVLGSVEVELSKLLDLQCGDVLRLPRQLDRGVSLRCERKPFANAVLGAAQGRKCVQVFAGDEMTSSEEVT
jgi:flagellar motor switch/type III secretory pathway protein FliN